MWNGLNHVNVNMTKNRKTVKDERISSFVIFCKWPEANDCYEIIYVKTMLLLQK